MQSEIDKRISTLTDVGDILKEVLVLTGKVCQDNRQLENRQLTEREEKSNETDAALSEKLSGNQ